MRNLETVKPSDVIPMGMPAELMEEERDDARAAQAQRVRRKVEQAQQQSAYEVAFTITINALFRSVEYLRREDVGSPFETGMQTDADGAWAMDLVNQEILNMARKTCGHAEFSVWLFRIGSVIRCVETSITNKDTPYARHLASMTRTIDVLGEMVDDAYRLGPKFLRREVMA